MISLILRSKNQEKIEGLIHKVKKAKEKITGKDQMKEEENQEAVTKSKVIGVRIELVEIRVLQEKETKSRRKRKERGKEIGEGMVKETEIMIGIKIEVNCLKEIMIDRKGKKINLQERIVMMYPTDQD